MRGNLAQRMKRKKKKPERKPHPSPELANMPSVDTNDRCKIGGVDAPVWTANKAKLIQAYLKGFVFVTKTGTYLDLFAGPQESEFPDTWAAKLVLESEPRWLKKFALFEKGAQSAKRLRELAQEHRRRASWRSIRVFHGDCNEMVKKYFNQNAIWAKEPTFCLLDQHTFQCSWETVQAIARHKRYGHKIELFYFLPEAWADRAVASNTPEALERWWGNKQWDEFKNTPWPRRGLLLAERFRKELKYKFAHPYPIYKKPTGGRVMFYMVHASDHPDARRLMDNAYRNCVAPLPKQRLEDVELFSAAP